MLSLSEQWDTGSRKQERDVLVTLVKLHVQGELAVLAPVNGLGARARLHCVGRKGRLEEGAGGIDLDVCGASGTAAAEEAHAVDLDLGRRRATGRSSSGEAKNRHKSVDELHCRKLTLTKAGRELE